MPDSMPESNSRYTLNMGTTKNRVPITDLPWFWICLFAAFGAMMLVIFSTKFVSRQVEIERKFQAHHRSGQSVPHPSDPDTLITEDRIILSQHPILVLLCVIVVVTWSLVWWQKRRMSVDKCNSGFENLHNDGGDSGETKNGLDI